MTNANNHFPTKEIVIDVISRVLFSDNIHIKDRISEIIIKNNHIAFSVEMYNIQSLEAKNKQEEISSILRAIYPNYQITIIITNEVKQHEGEKSFDKKNTKIDGVKNVIVIAAGKGGVGKSTITALLATALKNDGYKIGIVDADIYGPSIPRIFGLNKKPDVVNKKMTPLVKDGIQINSIGFLTPENTAINWRGPMASKALYQLLSLTEWVDLDFLIIDMPPGTGDIYLSLIQNYCIDGVIMITTPSKLSAIDVEKTIISYQKFSSNILGIIENMSYYEHNNQQISVFKGEGGEELSSKYNLTILNKLPLIPEIGELCDNGLSLNNYSHLINLERFFVALRDIKLYSIVL